MLDQSQGMLSPSSASTNQKFDGSHAHNGSRPGLEPPTSTSSRSRVFDRLKPWRSVASRRKSGPSSSSGAKGEDDLIAGDPYVVQAVGSGWGPGSGSHSSPDASRRSVDGYEWEGGSDDDDVGSRPDAYSWIDPSVVGTSVLGHSPSPGPEGDVGEPGAASSLLQGPITPVATREPAHVSPR
jgi:hypothetical protein